MRSSRATGSSPARDPIRRKVRFKDNSTIHTFVKLRK